MTSTAARIREESGLDVIYFTGSLQLAARRGTALAKGAITDGRIYIQADNPQYTVAQIGDHELYHHIARNNLGLIYAIRKAISERYSETDFEKIVSRYIESYFV